MPEDENTGEDLDGLRELSELPGSPENAGDDVEVVVEE